MSKLFIKQLIIYPIKSLGPIFKSSCEVGPRGLLGDREMMLVDSTGMFITQRTKVELVRFALEEFQSTYKIIDRWSSSEIVIDPDGFTDTIEQVEIWDDLVDHVLCHPEMSEWFSTILKEKVRLVKLKTLADRLISQKHQTVYSKSTSFADSLPLLVCSTSSLAFVANDYGDFNFLRFRPNIVIHNEFPFEEDHWNLITQNEVVISAKKKCARCNLITLDPNTGEIDKTFLGKLSKYRTVDQKVNFGVQFVPENGGILEIDKDIQVLT